METSGKLRIDRKSSIENEPRTLNISQMQLARDAALCVVKSRSIEEALSVFTEGLKPVVNSASAANINTLTMTKRMKDEVDWWDDDLQRIRGLRDIASAPF
ncbi:hypothetical protein NMG60_11007048 [Bertholletia excelsa]